MKEEIIRILTIFLLLITNTVKELIQIFTDSLKKEPMFCADIKIINDTILFVLWLFLVSSLLWMLYEIFKHLYLYFKLTSYRYFKEGGSKFADNPYFKQLENMFYLNNYFSIDFIFITYISTVIFVIVKLYIFHKINNNKNIHFRYIIFFCYISIFLGIIYYVLNYLNITNVGNALNAINRIFYRNINNDFINTKKICNYLDKKNEFDKNFVYGKCNDLKNNISVNRLYEYIKTNFDDITRNVSPTKNMKISQFKTLADKNGILYKDKIVSALFTYQILKYFVDNDLLDEAKDFFSAFNMIYTPNINIIKKKVNPILYFKLDNFMLFDYLFQFEGELKDSFYGNKEIFEFIKLEYNKIQNQIQKIVVDIYDICTTKLISIYVYYFSLFIIMIILIIFHQYYPKFIFYDYI
jgi:hypothetical protein